MNTELLTNTIAEKVAEDYLTQSFNASALRAMFNEMVKEALVDCRESGVVNDIAEEVIEHGFCTCGEISKKELNEIETEEQKKNAELFKQLFKSLEKYEVEYKAMLASVWEKERKIIVANLKKMKKAWLQKDLIDDILYPVGPFEKELSANASKIDLRIIDQQGNMTMDPIAATDVLFDVTNPEVAKWLKSYTPKFSKELEAVNVSKLRRELSAGMEAGEGIPELMNRVNDTYANWNKVRSESIARSEVMRASNQGSLEAYKQSGVVKAKVWVTHFDNRTCAWCKKMNNKVIDIEKPFFSQGSKFTVDVEGKPRTMNLDYETVSAPPLHTACRCTTAASFYDISEGVSQPRDLFSDIKTDPTKYKKEYGAWFDKNGKVVLSKRGTATQISLTDANHAKLAAQDLGKMIHTHPQNMAFSGGDLAHAAGWELQEIQVLTNKGLYKVKPAVGRGGNWGFAKETIGSEFKDIMDSLNEKYTKRFRQLFEQGKTSIEAKAISVAEHIDEVNKVLAKKYHLDYSFVGD